MKIRLNGIEFSIHKSFRMRIHLNGKDFSIHKSFKLKIQLNGKEFSIHKSAKTKITLIKSFVKFASHFGSQRSGEGGNHKHQAARHSA